MCLPGGKHEPIHVGAKKRGTIGEAQFIIGIGPSIALIDGVGVTRSATHSHGAPQMRGIAGKEGERDSSPRERGVAGRENERRRTADIHVCGYCRRLTADAGYRRALQKSRLVTSQVTKCG